MKPEFSVVAKIIRAINSPKKSIDEILHIIMMNISEIIQAEAWTLFLVDENTKELIFYDVFGEKKDELTGLRIPMNKGIVGWVVKNKKPVLVADVRKDNRFFSDIDKKSKFTTKSILAIPMISKGKLLGVIEVINKKGSTVFTKDDLRIVKTYVDQAALALENASLLKRLNQKINYLTLLSQINRNITSFLEIEKLLKKSAEVLKNSFNYQYVYIGVFTDDKIIGDFSVSDDFKIFPEFFEKNVKIEKLKKDKNVIIDNVPSDENIKSEIYIPLKKKGVLLGFIRIGSLKSFDFNNEEIEVLKQVSTQLAIAIENAKLYKKIYELAYRDDLTGFYNYRYIDEPLEKIIQDAKEKKYPVSVIFMDIDHFKWVNDQYDHLVGSRTLSLVARRIKKYLPSGTISIRYGGDEYILVLPEKDLKDAVEFAEFLRKKISERDFVINKKYNVKIRASFGVSSFPDPSKSKEELIRDADIAMYKVKEVCRNNVAYYHNGKVVLLNE